MKCMKEYINKNIKPAFPIYDKDFKWENFSKGRVPIIFDEFIYKNMSVGQFEKEYLNHKVIDCLGKEFIITGRRKSSKWRKLLPWGIKFILEFKEIGSVYSLAEMKNNIIEKIIENVPKNDIRDSWIEEISKMQSIPELLSENTAAVKS